MAPKTNHLAEFLKKIEFPLHLIAYVLIGLAILYEQQIPDNLKSYGPNPLYRIIAFGTIIGVSLLISPLHALLVALIVVLYVSFTPGYNTEGYEDTKVVNKRKHKWYDEIVLSENPVLLQNDKVVTQAPNT